MKILIKQYKGALLTTKKYITAIGDISLRLTISEPETISYIILKGRCFSIRSIQSINLKH